MTDNNHLTQTPNQISDDGEKTDRLDALIQEGILVHQAGNLEEAETIYRKVLTVNPDHADAHHLLGVIAFQVGKLEKSLELITRAVTINPEKAQYFCNLGNTQYTLGFLDDATASYQEALLITPDHGESHNNLGNLLQEMEFLEDALICYDRAVIINPQNVEAYTNRGVVLQKLRRDEDASESYRKALTINPYFADAKSKLESLQIKSGGRHLKSSADVVPSVPRASSNCNLLIATMPRSGTHYLQQIFHILAVYCAPLPGMEPTAYGFPAPHVARYPNLGLGLFGVGHAAFPIIEKTLEGHQLRKWQSLNYFHSGHDIFLKLLMEYDSYVDLLGSKDGFDFNDKDSKIVFVYRNPLDHFVSYYNSHINHVDPSTRGYTDKDGEFHFFENFEEFIFKGGLDSYLKLYASYAWSMPKYADRILMMSYESIIKDSHAAICAILVFTGSAPDPELITNELDLAIACSAPRVLKLLERKFGITLGRNQRPSREQNSHIHSGGTGTWLNLIDRNAVRKIEHRFNEFGFTLKDFDIGADLDDLLS